MTPKEAESIVAELLRRSHVTPRPPLYCPQKPHPKQQAFLELDTQGVDESLFGGAAGGGKSSTLLMDASRYLDVPGYSAIILRKTYADLSLPGAIMDRSREWWASSGARWDNQKHVWEFPNAYGPPARISFGYMETDADRFRYQGAEFQRIYWDELAQHTQVRYSYMASRLRRTSGALDAVPLFIGGGTNPGGVGHRWIMRRFGLRMDGTQDLKAATDPQTGKLRVFIRSLLEDNPSLDIEAYRAGLAKLDPVTRDQLERGLWVSETGKVFYYDPARNDVPELPAMNGWRYILAVDIGASETTPTTSFTVVAWHPHVTQAYAVKSFKEANHIPTTIAERVRSLESDFGEFQRYVMDEGALGKGYANEMRRVHGIPFVPAMKQNKDAFRKMLNGALYSGDLLIVASQCEPLVAELDGLTWDDSGTEIVEGDLGDHCSDGLLYAWRESRSHLSEAPAQRPTRGTPEWDEAEAQRILNAELAALQKRKAKPDWESW